jgi:hypothetical protein
MDMEIFAAFMILSSASFIAIVFAIDSKIENVLVRYEKIKSKVKIK